MWHPRVVRPSRASALTLFLLLVAASGAAVGCSDARGTVRTFADAAPRDVLLADDTAAADAEPADPDARGREVDAGLDPALDAAVDPVDAGPGLLDPRACVYRSTSYDGPMLELDVAPTSSERLVFTVPGLADPSLVVVASLVFQSWDADHPGEEGVITVNGMGPYDLPAMLAWDNTDGTGTVDVTGALAEGTNRIEFGPGPLSRSLFRIGSVRLELSVRVDACEPPPGPTPVVRELHFHEATYTNRATWVIPCPPGDPRFAAIRDYVFTADGAEHDATDCDGGYMPGGSRRGTATFTFDGVVPATYGVYVRFRTSANRNPGGALFVVEGEEQRIDQVDPSGAYREVLFGDRPMSGTVTVVLDSSREAESDSVTWVRLVPR